MQASLFSEISGGMKAYGISTHRHAPEVEFILSAQGNGPKVGVQFTPQIVPMNRGILSNIYIDSNKSVSEIINYLEEFYSSSKFVHICKEGRAAPSTREVYGTNQCRIGVFSGRQKGKIVIVSVIDNLVKGASGQAVQNMNIMFDLPEEIGLDMVSIYP